MPVRTLTVAGLSLGLATTLAIQGCWHPPTANTEPSGVPRLIESAVGVESTWSPVIVRAINSDKRYLELLAPGELRPIRSAAHLDHALLERLQVGDTLRAILQRELTIFVSADRTLQLPGAGRLIVGGARVLAVDPSYRVLTLEFSDGRQEVYKVNRVARLSQVEPGDDVAFRTIDVIELRSSSR